MDVVTAGEGPYQEGDAARFTGRVWLSPGLSTPGGTGMMVVHFSAGARTHWHAHPGGQLLYGVSGRGRVRSRGGPGHVLVPGDVVHIPPGEWHFHGGAPDSPMAQRLGQPRRGAPLGRPGHRPGARRGLLRQAVSG